MHFFYRIKLINFQQFLEEISTPYFSLWNGDIKSLMFYSYLGACVRRNETVMNKTTTDQKGSLCVFLGDLYCGVYSLRPQQGCMINSAGAFCAGALGRCGERACCLMYSLLIRIKWRLVILKGDLFKTEYHLYISSNKHIHLVVIYHNQVKSGNQVLVNCFSKQQ